MAKYIIGVTALTAVILLGIAGYKGKLKSIQKFLGLKPELEAESKVNLKTETNTKAELEAKAKFKL